MADTVEIPKIGKVDKKWVYAGAAVTVGIVGYAYWKSRTVAPSDAGTYQPDTSAYATDSGLGTGNYTNPNPSASGSDNVNDSTEAITTDSQWSQKVIETMTWLDSGYLANILGKYLDRQGLTDTEADIIRSAWAYVGHPPGNQQIVKAQTSQPDKFPGGYAEVKAGWRVDQWITDVQKQGVPDFSWVRFLALNPQFNAKTDMDYHGSGSADNTFKRGAIYKVK